MQQISTSNPICLIDDDQIYLFTAKRMVELVAPEQEVIVFNNGQQAIEYFEKQAYAENTLPGIILLDINMPVMDGWEFLDAFNAMKSQLPNHIKLYMVSSSISEKDKMRSKSFEFVTDFISKPIDKQRMKQILQEPS